jgi:nitroreductase
MKKSSEPLTGDALEQFRQKRVYPQLMVVSQVRSDDQVRAREDYAAVACAIQNFTLALCARGVGSKWSTGRMTQHDLAYEVAQVDAEVEEIVGFLWYGFAARTPQVRRPDLSLVYRSTP